MKLAEQIIIIVGGEPIELRPSLACAMRLERRPGSFAGLFREIMDGSLSAAVDIIAPHADDMPFLESRVFDALPHLREPLLAYVMACAGIDPEERATDKTDTKGDAKSVPFSEHLSNLYRIGTGWLGWTPADTLDATPAEIMEAHAGRLDMLKAIFGSSEQSAPPKDDRPLDQKFRSIFASHGTVKEGE